MRRAFRRRRQIETADDAIACGRRVRPSASSPPVGDGRRATVTAGRCRRARARASPPAPRAGRGVRCGTRNDRHGGRSVLQFRAGQPAKYASARRQLRGGPRRSVRERVPSASSARGTITTTASVPAIRCSQGAAFTLAGVHRGDPRNAGHWRRGQPRAGGVGERGDRTHHGASRERALPRRAELQRDAAQIQAREHAERQRRSGQEDARGARGVQRRRAHRPLLREFRQRLRHRVGGLAPDGCALHAREPRDGPRSGPIALACRTARRIPRQDRVDREVPHEEQQHRREDADAARADVDRPRCRARRQRAMITTPTHRRDRQGAHDTRQELRASGELFERASVARRATNAAGGASAPTTRAAARLAHARSSSVHSSSGSARSATSPRVSAVRSSAAAPGAAIMPGNMAAPHDNLRDACDVGVAQGLRP